MQDLGYVTYPLSPAVNGKPMHLNYKVWVELHPMAPNSWNVLSIMHAVNSFGALLDHSPMSCVKSLKKMIAVVGVPKLELVPRNATVWVKGVA